MRQKLILAVAAAACLFATAVVLQNRKAPVVHAQASGCTLASFTGAYGYNLTGFWYDQSDYTYYIGATGRIVSDGNGNLTGADTFVYDFYGAGPRQNTGTYTINEDCTGTLTFSGTYTNPNITQSGNLPMTTNASFVLVNNGKEIDLVQTDLPWVINGTLKKQDQTVQAVPSAGATQ